jgi:hypothetical protein
MVETEASVSGKKFVGRKSVVTMVGIVGMEIGKKFVGRSYSV